MIHMYNRGIAQTAIHSSFKLEPLPPTSAAARQHSFRVYLQTQQWRGNELDALKWGWKHMNGKLAPHLTTLPAAPDEQLRIISCNCKKGCITTRCERRRAGLHSVQIYADIAMECAKTF